jgi:hypothetical protein
MSKRNLVFVLVILVGAPFLLGRCGSDENKVQPPSAVLTAVESSQVPGRIVLDASQSTGGSGEIVEYTFSIDDAGGKTVAGPFTTQQVSEYSVVSSIHVAGTYTARLTVVSSNGESDSTEVEVSHDSEVVFGTVSASLSALTSVSYIQASVVDNGQISCSQYSETSLIVCVLPTSATSIDLETDVLPLAQQIDSNTDNETVMWMQAWGAKGGSGDKSVLGCSAITGCPGGVGQGGLAQTITTIQNFKAAFGGSTLYYYLGKSGTHFDTGGQGGASTLVTTKNLESISTTDLDLANDVVLIAGGGGGGGAASLSYDGHAGASGGAALSNAEGPFIAETVAVGAGGNSNQCTGGSESADGAGGVTGSGGNSEDSTGGSAGIGGGGGMPQAFDEANNTWINGSPKVGSAGHGGNAGSQTLAGGGGGGYGGGGGEGGDDNHFGGCDLGGSDCPGYGGCGGGSYAARSFGNDSLAPNDFVANPDTANGEVRIVFDPI